MDLVERRILERRIEINGNGAWVGREGNSIKIRHDYAGRLTEEDQRFSARDIETLAQFVKDTDDPKTVE